MLWINRPAYFLVVPPGHADTATALNAEMSKLHCQGYSQG
jgi:hypothetical protein